MAVILQFSLVEKFVLEFAFAPLLGLTVRRKCNVYVVQVCFSFRFLFFNELRLFYSLPFAGFIVILLSFWFLLPLQHVCGLCVCFFLKKQLLYRV